MTEARPADLVYGHLGEAVYDTDNKEWHFARRPFTGRQLHPIGQPTVVFEALLAHNPSNGAQGAITRTRNIKKLAQTYPELVPGISLLPALAQVSEIVCEATSRYDPSVSELLAFGTALNRDNPRKGSKTVSIIATAGGEAGEAVRLACLRRRQIGWHANNTIGLNCPEVENKEQGWWSGYGGPIQQLCFAEGEGNANSWLAVRYPGATTILRPNLHRRTTLPVSSSSSKPRDLYPASRLDPNPVATVPIERSGGAPHANVSFNPWFEKQLAIVDQEGRWSVWDIENQNSRRNLWAVKAGSAGNIHDGQNEGLDSSYIDADGWGSILWACNVHTLLVFSRRTFVLCNIKEDLEPLAGPDLALTKTVDWILDVKRSPSDKSHVFVVTSSRIFWLRIIGFGEMKTVGDPDVGAKILLSWRHFLDQMDISLGLSVLMDTGRTLAPAEIDSVISETEPASTVLLYSRLTGLTTVYTFQMSPSPSDFPLSASDPYVLRLSNTVNESDEPLAATHLTQCKTISTLVLKNVEYGLRSTSTPSGPGYHYAKGNVKFYQLSTLFNDLTVQQSLYASAPAGHIRPIRPPDFEVHIELRKSALVVEDSFIVPNGGEKSQGPKSHTRLKVLRTREPLMDYESASDEGDPWTLNFGWLERHVQSFGSSSWAIGRTTSPVAQSFDDVLNVIKSVIVDNPTCGEPGIKLLVEDLSMQNLIADVEQASMDLYHMMKSATEENDHIKRIDLTSSSILLVTNPDLVVPEELSLLQIYDSLIRRWITPLAPSIPGRVRVTIEKQLREIAAHVCLASYGIQSKPVPSKDKDDVPTEQGLFTLPVRRKPSFTKLTKKGKERRAPSRSSSPLQSSQLSQDAGFTQSNLQPASGTLPTPDRTPLYFTSSASSYPRSEDPASQRLRALASLNPQPLLPTSMENTLSHWAVGTDPGDYDWEAMQVAPETEDTETEAQTKKRRKLEKKLKRKRENMMPSSSSQPVPTLSSQLAPLAVSASQPQAARGTRNITLFSDGVAPATQEMPGPFGGRLRGKKTKIGGARMGGRKKKPGF